MRGRTSPQGFTRNKKCNRCPIGDTGRKGDTMNETIKAIFELAIARAKTAREFAMLQNMVEDMYFNEVITDFDTLCDIKTQLTLGYMELCERNEKEG